MGGRLSEVTAAFLVTMAGLCARLETHEGAYCVCAVFQPHLGDVTETGAHKGARGYTPQSAESTAGLRADLCFDSFSSISSKFLYLEVIFGKIVFME